MSRDFMDLELDNEPWNSTSATVAAAAAADFRRRSPAWAEEQLMELIWQNGVMRLPVSCPPATVGDGDGFGLAEAADRLLMEEDEELASWLNHHIDTAEGGGEGNTLLVREEADAMMTTVGSNVTPTAAAAVQGLMVAGPNETPVRTSASSSVSDERKRKKARVAEEEEHGCHTEQWKDAEFDGSSGRKDAPQCASVRKQRSAEIHNRSERKRRNRINTKLKALQELIPKCNKCDKASTLDEAIEYVKSLQHQVQLGYSCWNMEVINNEHSNKDYENDTMMSMGWNAGPLMFPGIHTCLPPMGMGMHMGLGMGMGLGMTTGGTKTFTGNLVYPMHQFGPIPCPAISGHPSVQLSPRPLLVPFHSSAVPAADQTRCEAINQQNHSSDAAKITNSSTAQIPYIGDPYHGFLTLQHFLAQAQSSVPGEVESAKEIAAQKATTG